MFVPPIERGLLRCVASARFGDSSSPTMIRPSGPYISSECAILPPSPSILSLTANPNASHSQSIARAASW